MEKLEKENNMLKKELSTLKQEKECLNVKPFAYNVSCDTNDLSDYRIEKCDFVEVVCNKESNDEHENFIDRNYSYYNDNIGLKIMERMGFKGKGLGKDEEGLMNLIETIVRPKYVGLGYDAGSGKMNKGSRRSIESIKTVKCSHCNRKGHTNDRCWDIHPCNICVLKNHRDKTCWNRECNKDFMVGCIKMDCGWSYESNWKKIVGMIRGLFRYKCSSVQRNASALGNI